MKTIVTNSEKGLTLVEVVVVIAVLVLLIVGGILPFAGSNGAKERAQRINCVNNQRQIGPALKLWASFHDDKYMMEVSVTNGGTMELVANGLAYMQFGVISNELYGPKILLCPADSDRAVARSFQDGDFGNTNLSYFLNVDMTTTNTYPFFVGDRNLSLSNVPVKPGLVSISPNSPLGWTAGMHHGQGNMMLADGSVEQLHSSNLHRELDFPGNGVNRWAVP